MSYDAAWIDCATPGCDAGIQIDARHARNFAGRDWYCVRHQERKTG